METQTATPGTNGKTRKVTARKDESRQEKVIELDVLREKKQHLIELYKHAEAVNADLNDAIKAAAEAAGLQASVVKKYIVARAGEKFEEKKRDVLQLALIFSEAV